jgi:hypothetical protein
MSRGIVQYKTEALMCVISCIGNKNHKSMFETILSCISILLIYPLCHMALSQREKGTFNISHNSVYNIMDYTA